MFVEILPSVIRRWHGTEIRTILISQYFQFRFLETPHVRRKCECTRTISTGTRLKRTLQLRFSRLQKSLVLSVLHVFKRTRYFFKAIACWKNVYGGKTLRSPQRTKGCARSEGCSPIRSKRVNCTSSFLKLPRYRVVAQCVLHLRTEYPGKRCQHIF